MGFLAIQGHHGKGKDVISILESLGGINKNRWSGSNESLCYYIKKENGLITGKSIKPFEDCDMCCCYTINQFNELYPYYIGDEVKYSNEIYIIKSMIWNPATNKVEYKIAQINGEKENVVSVEELLYTTNTEDGNNASVEGLFKNNETYEMKHKVSDDCEFEICKVSKIAFEQDKTELLIDDKFEVVVENGKIYVVRKKIDFPKNYEECCKVLGIEAEVISTSGYGASLMHEFRKLLICRDAYWKLDNNWKPSFNSDKNGTYVLCNYIGIISNDLTYTYNHAICFSSPEIREIFYNNFRDLLNKCKELI